MNKPAAGWYPDPSGRPGQRYHDGQRWTEHFAPPPLPYPYPPQPIVPGGYYPQPPAVAVAVSTGGGVNHALHAVLTFFTCGMWLPVWILVSIFNSSSGSAVAVAGPGARVPPNRKPLIVAGVVLGWIMLGASLEHPWLLAILIPTIGIGGLIFWMRKDDEKRKRLAAHAEYEDRLYYEGDPRGTYGRYMPPSDHYQGDA